MEVRYVRGVHLPGQDVWLDPADRREFAFVSHAHSDHVACHARILCTPATAQLAQARGACAGSAFETAGFGERREMGGWQATLLAAGHVLGSAQLLVEAGGERLLYTGDFKRRAGRSCEPAACCHADTLIMETTFGLPRYRFPPVGETMAAVQRFCWEAIEDGVVPVLLGYSLGKAQEILALLGGCGLPVMLHDSVAKLAAVYDTLGVTLPPHAAWDPTAACGHVVIAPPGAASALALAAIRPRRVAMLTGWAMDPGAVQRLGVDAAYPLSDHADYDELLEHVEAVAPRRVLTLHGFAADFARDLRARGVEAWALTEPDQLEWDAIVPARAPARGVGLPPLGERGFEAFAAVCEEIRRSTGTRHKTEVLASYLRRLDARGLRVVPLWLSGRAFAASSGRVLDAGAAVIRKALVMATGLPEGAVRAAAREHNDTGRTVESLLGLEARPWRPKSLGDMAAFFEALAAARSPLGKAALLGKLLAESHPLAAAYAVRILTGNLRIGLKEGLVEEGIAEAFDVPIAEVHGANMGDPGALAALAATRRLDEVRLALFQPAKCMLASPVPDAAALWSRLGGGGWVWAEPKMDGVRAQAHCDGRRVELYSRDLRRVTDSFPEIAAALRHCGLRGIFDGEIFAWAGGRPLPFAALQRRLGRRSDDLFLPPDVPVALALFDVLAWEGDVLLRTPLLARRAHLDKIPWVEPLLSAPVVRAESPEAIEAALHDARARGHEGLVAKDPESAYTPGRRGMAWAKLKPELATLDVVVVAAEFGHGRRSRVLSDLTFAVRDGAQILPIGKAYTGLTDAEIEELTALFLSTALRRAGNRVEVEPKVVLEVAFDGIQPSGRHAAGLALRFPRIKRIRTDKSAADIATLAEARRLAGPEDSRPGT